MKTSMSHFYEEFNAEKLVDYVMDDMGRAEEIFAGITEGTRRCSHIVLNGPSIEALAAKFSATHKTYDLYNDTLSCASAEVRFVVKFPKKEKSINVDEIDFLFGYEGHLLIVGRYLTDIDSERFMVYYDPVKREGVFYPLFP